MVVGFSQIDSNGAWRIAETQSMRDAAQVRADRLELLVTEAQDQTAKQISDVEDLIARRVSALFIAPREYDGLEPALESAAHAKIPVILVDRQAAGEAGVDYVTFVGSDFVEEGRRAARWLIDATGGQARIAELTGTPGSSVARDRAQGFREVLQSAPNMEVLISQTGFFSRADGQKVMLNMLQSRGNAITAIYCHNDEMALGAIRAIRESGREPGRDIIVVSIDGERAALDAIVRGELGASVECNPRLGPLAFEALERHLAGQPVAAKTVVPDRLFTKANAQQFVTEAY
jgi:ribose transport system substrate-binding protein